MENPNAIGGKVSWDWGRFSHQLLTTEGQQTLILLYFYVGQFFPGLFLELPCVLVSFHFIYCCKYPDKKQQNEGKGLFGLQFQITVHHFRESQGRNPSSLGMLGS